MIRLAIVAYLVVEIAAFWALTHFLNFGWALLITVGAAAVGFAVLGRRARTLTADLRRAARREPTDARPAGDSVLFAGAALFTVLPGVVSTVVGLLLMTPPARKILRPAVEAGMMRRASILVAGVPGGRAPGGRYVDGTVEGSVVDETSDVVDVTARRPDGSVYIDLPGLPEPPATRP
ncbi:FxsA family protein [Gordonia liuliyuniae]|uniref:FxsA family protein n=1 Tax=Gordonia liuliyuniae TaxID=2911517 RepID=A0ABS9IQQ6_9ACTN|nr:FxsA family protein [Gordonia liuliyuniae]MCF8587884.1 FxsA family protein [Gordonia liuliyuniae]